MSDIVLCKTCCRECANSGHEKCVSGTNQIPCPHKKNSKECIDYVINNWECINFVQHYMRKDSRYVTLRGDKNRKNHYH